MAEDKPIEDTSSDAVANPVDGAGEAGPAELPAVKSVSILVGKTASERRHLTRPSPLGPLGVDKKLLLHPCRKLLRRHRRAVRAWSCAHAIGVTLCSRPRW
jgi:hypothetical protein